MPSYKITHSSHMVEKKGEDRCATHSATIGEDEPLFLALVADGHGGHRVAERLANELLPAIVARARDASAEQLETAMKDAFEHMHQTVRATGISDGSTCTVVAIAQRNGTVTCGNVGDSFAYGFSHGTSPEDAYPMHLTTSHRLSTRRSELGPEARRVQEAGGALGRARQPSTGEAGGPLRAYPGGLAMGRSIGDADCGDWLTPAPSVWTGKLPAATCDILLASDGIWDALSLRDVYEKVERFPPVSRSVKDLVNAAVTARGLHDDISAVLIRIEPEESSPGPGGSRGSPLRVVRSLFHKDSRLHSWHDEFSDDPRMDDFSCKAGSDSTVGTGASPSTEWHASHDSAV